MFKLQALLVIFSLSLVESKANTLARPLKEELLTTRFIFEKCWAMFLRLLCEMN